MNDDVHIPEAAADVEVITPPPAEPTDAEPTEAE